MVVLVIVFHDRADHKLTKVGFFQLLETWVDNRVGYIIEEIHQFWHLVAWLPIAVMFKVSNGGAYLKTIVIMMKCGTLKIKKSTYSKVIGMLSCQFVHSELNALQNQMIGYDTSY